MRTLNSGSKGVSFFSRMSTKIALMVGAVVFITVIVQVLAASDRASKAMEKTYLNYAQNLAEEASLCVNFAAEFGEEAYGGYTKNLAQEAAAAINFSRRFCESVYKSYAQNLAEEAASGISIASEGGNLSREMMNHILHDIAIKDVKGSYAYMVSPNGTMLWHPDESKIGQPVENAAVKRIVSDLKLGYKVENGSVLYDYRNAKKLAGYAFTSDGNILIVTADYSEFMKIDYASLLGSIHIDGVEGSYAYMVSPNGTMLWHTDSGKIGKPVENDAVKKIVANIQKGMRVSDGYVIYEYRGAMKMAGYSFTDTGNIVLVTADYDKLIVIDYDRIIGGIKISGVSGSYAYMVSRNGTMLYHTDKSKIGNPVENAAVRGIVADINAGRDVHNGSCMYDYKGAYKAAGYAFTKSGNIVIVTADKDVMMSAVARMRKSLIIYGIICEIAAVILVYLFTVLMLKALGRIIPVINRTAELDLSECEESERLESRSDEIGMIARALAVTRGNFHDIIESISGACESIESNIEELKNKIQRVGIICENNSSVAEELSAGMNETAEGMTAITKNAENVKNDAHNIDTLAEEGTIRSGEVLARANELASATENAAKRTEETYRNVKVKSEKALSASEAVDRINNLIGTIMSISTQTGMLSLNASIEASRAGEGGRGFSVVPLEIRNLSEQTSEVVKNISAIISEVIQAVHQMSECLNEATDFLETQVLTDYHEFSNVSRQYKSDADTFRSSMEAVKKSIKTLNDEIEDITESIIGIDTTVSESSSGVSDIANKTSEMAEDTSGSVKQFDGCMKAVNDLDDMIHKFRL